MADSKYFTFMKDEGKHYGVRVTKLNNRGTALLYEKDGKQVMCYNGVVTQYTGAVGPYIAHSKNFTQQFLSEYGFSVLPTITTTKEDLAYSFFKKHKVIVLKPVNQSAGKGITTGIASKKDFERAWKIARSYSKHIVVQKHFDGQDMRVTVVGKKVFGVVRTPAFIIGDGVLTVSELIDQKNAQRDLSNGNGEIPKNRHVKYQLSLQKLKLDSVPKKNQRVQLLSVANLSRGGESEVVKVPSQFAKEAIKIAEKLNMQVVGVDFLFKNNRYYIIEINSSPGFRLHHFPTIGKPEIVSKTFFDYIFNTTPITITSFSDFQKIKKEKLFHDQIFYGLGVTAYMRTTLVDIVKNLEIICYKDSKDNAALRLQTPVYCYQELYPEIKLPKINAGSLLGAPEVRSHIKQTAGKKNLFVYKLNKSLSKNSKGLGVNKVIAVSSTQNKKYEKKDKFRKVLESIGISPIPGKIYPINEFLELSYKEISEQYGKKIVLQMPDFLLGGGKGTVFINSSKEFYKFTDTLRETGTYKKTTIKQMIVMPFIQGTSASVVACATRHGVFSSRINNQIIDRPEVMNTNKGSGVFVGHEFTTRYSEKIEKQARELVVKIGEYMYEHGYKGIFGIDIIVDTKNQKVYPVECNARYTGAFPMISSIHEKNKIVPLDIFHLLELMDVEYEVNFNAIQKLYSKPITGSHIILSNKKEDSFEVTKEMMGGRYKIGQNGKLTYLEPTVSYSNISSTNECIICDGNPKKGQVVFGSNELSRIVHMLFPGKLIDTKGNIIPKYKAAIKQVYKIYS